MQACRSRLREADGDRLAPCRGEWHSLRRAEDGSAIGIRNDEPGFLRQHLDRLRHSALALAFRDIPTAEAIVADIRRTLAANQMSDGVHIRLTLTRGVK